MVDSGAGISILPASMYDVIKKSQALELVPSDRKIFNASGDQIKCYGMVDVKVSIEKVPCPNRFYVCEEPTYCETSHWLVPFRWQA